MMIKKRKILDTEEKNELENIEKLEAESRRVFDPIKKGFDHGKKRVIDLQENGKVTLPRPCNPHTESSIEMLNNSIMKSFNKCQRKYCNENGDKQFNQSNEEQRGLRKYVKGLKIMKF